MSIKPKLVCPPDYSILSLRFTECKKLGVVKGITTLLAVDLQDFFIPLTNFSERRFTLKAGKTQKIDISDIAVYADLKEQYTFKYKDAAVADGTSHIFSMYDEEGVVLLGQIAFTVDINNPLFATFAKAFATALGLNLTLAGYMTAAYGPLQSQVTATATSPGVKYTYLLEYDTTGWGLTNPHPYNHPGTLVTKFQKYPEGRVRALFLYADYGKANPDMSTCNCCNASGDLMSNVKNFKWMFDEEYTKKQKAEYTTNVLLNSDAGNIAQQNPNGTQTFQWLSVGNAAAYNLEVGNLITINTTAYNPYGYITDIDGYNITVNRQGFGTGNMNDMAIKSWVPTTLEWKTGGEMLFLSGGQDVYDTDHLYMQTIWLQNPQNYDIPFTAIIVS